MVFVNFYFEDFPNFNGLAAGLDLWYNFWDEIKYKNDLPDSIYIFGLKATWDFAFYNL